MRYKITFEISKLEERNLVYRERFKEAERKKKFDISKTCKCLEVFSFYTMYLNLKAKKMFMYYFIIDYFNVTCFKKNLFVYLFKK